MANRHLARSIVMQTLFEWDFKNLDEKYAVEALSSNVADFGPGLNDSDFLEELLVGTIRKKTVIDEIIEKAAPDWPIEKISGTDRNILRLGLYELLFGDYEQVPPKVAINEAIELAKSFGGENSGKFVNGVLGAVYKEIGEPGKDQTSKKKDDPVDMASLPVEEKAGAVIYNLSDEGEINFCFVHDVFGYWTLSKGSIEEGETPQEGAAREVKEETNLDVTILDKLGENEYIARHPQKGKVRKHVQYFLASSDLVEPKLEEDSGGLNDVRWFKAEEVENLTMYDDIVEMVARSIEIITK